MVRRSIIFLVALCCLWFCPVYGQLTDSFHAERKIAHEIKVPADIIRKIDGYNTERYKACYINLGAKSKSILVQGDDGANNTGFWIFTQLNNKWTLLLEDRGLDLTIQTQITKGLRDIEVVGCWVAGCRHRVYQFNGASYSACKCYDETDKGITRFKCPEQNSRPWPIVTE